MRNEGTVGKEEQRVVSGSGTNAEIGGIKKDLHPSAQRQFSFCSMVPSFTDISRK